MGYITGTVKNHHWRCVYVHIQDVNNDYTRLMVYMFTKSELRTQADCVGRRGGASHVIYSVHTSDTTQGGGVVHIYNVHTQGAHGGRRWMGWTVDGTCTCELSMHVSVAVCLYSSMPSTLLIHLKTYAPSPFYTYGALENRCSPST